MNTTSIKLSDLMKGQWKQFSIATCEERGIPQFADGLKPVQRFILMNGFKLAKNKFTKVAEVGSSVASLGYEHGEASACGALTLMASYFSNNLALFEGEGAFGNVLDPTPAASRYIFCKVNDAVDYLFKDTELAPKNPDPEILTPLYYLPIIPMCLVNGIKGIATGYAVDIPPHDPISIINALIAKCDNKKKIPEVLPKYYLFSGSINKDSDHYILTGSFTRKSATHIIVTELPHIFNTSLSYETFLRKLVEKGTIVNYENYSVDDKFNYDITLKRGTNWTDEQVIKNLKLSVTHTWNLTTVMPDGHLHVWDKTTGIEDIVNQFYSFRIPFIQTRINNKINELDVLIRYYTGFIKFITDVINKKVVLKDMTDESFHDKLESVYKIPDQFIDKVMNAPFRTLTIKNIEALSAKKTQAEIDLEYYKNTTKEIEYKKDLVELKTFLSKKK